MMTPTKFEWEVGDLRKVTVGLARAWVPPYMRAGSRVRGYWRNVRSKNSMLSDTEFKERYGQERPKDGRGNCYKTAFDLMMDLEEDQDRYRYCTGVVTGAADAVKGLRFDHAWVEREDKLNIPEDLLASWKEHGAPEEMIENTSRIFTVLDKSNGNEVEMLREVYYLYGHIDQESVRRYTMDEMIHEALTRGYLGVWD